MSVDKILMIPYLSKELNLVGHPKLPYRVKNTRKKNKTLNKDDKDDLKIVFDSKKMIESLIFSCFELLKQVKSLGFDVNDDEIEKLRFENSKMDNQIKLNKIELEKKINELATEKKKNQHLQENIFQLQQTVKENEVEKKKLIQKHSTNEDILKHSLKKKDSDLNELHTVIWKKYNMAGQNFFPKNFDIIQLEQPDFNKLWSEVKYSDINTKEKALKRAVCIFQENNKHLAEFNRLLKSLLFVTLDEINEMIELFKDKMHLNKIDFKKKEVCEIFKEVDRIDVPEYKKVLSKCMSLFTKVCEFFEEASFIVSDDIFVCWSEVIAKLKNWSEEVSE